MAATGLASQPACASAPRNSSLISFITGLPGIQLEALFEQPYAVVAILRSLPPLARHMLLRFACSSGEVNTALVSSWAKPDGDSKLASALQELTGLRLLAQVARSGQPAYVVNQSFQAQLRQAMCSGLLSGQLEGPLSPQQAAAVAAAAPTPADLSAYARHQWEALLLYLVGGSSMPPAAPAVLQAVPVDVAQLLASAGLMLKDEYTLQQSISERGFQFLLADLYSQLWTVVRQYLSSLAEAGSADLAVAVNFLLRLGLQAGQAMACSQLAPPEQAIAAHMAQLGLLMPVASGGGGVQLYPTRLAAVLAGGGRAGEAAAAAEDAFAIVESNFRVYAYTTSPVQVAVLRVFVRCDALLPNLFVGTITRESATGALALGITAEQMVAYLRQHAHPRVAAKSPIVPLVVADQVRLWQQELRRLTSQPAALYGSFEGPQLYASAVAYAQQLGALLYRNDERQQVAVASAFHDLMRQHIRNTKQQLGL